MPNISVSIGKLKFKNPVMVASGTFGYAEEFTDFINLKDLGAVVTKTITLKPRRGNVPPRTCETPSGLLNSIGLENPGVEAFIREKLPSLRKIGIPVIVSIASEGSPEEFVTLSERLDGIKEISGIELNISCPNIKLAGGPVSLSAGSTRTPAHQHTSTLISQDAKATYKVVKSVRKATKKTLITKLSPNVTDIVEIAQAAERAGSDAISLINTLTGMSVDIGTRRPKIGAVTGGLSGPAVRPVAVRMVWEAYKKIRLPIIGMGGIINTSSALEFIIAGATSVAVGTGNFINPRITAEIIAGLEEYLVRNKIKDIRGLIGSLKI